jgi:hypothetical protein
MSWREYPPVERAIYHLARARAWARRVTAMGLGVRAVIWLTGLGALLLAMPASLRLGPALLVAVGLALLPAAAPGGGWVALLELVAIGTVAGVAVAGVADPPALPVLLLLAALLYGHHTAAALGAQLRTDAVIPLSVPGYWALRAAAVLAASVAVGLGVVGLAGRAAAGPATGYLAVGVAAAVAVALAVAWLVDRRTGGIGG